MGAFKCPKCGKTTGGNETYCIECGHPLNTKCPKCGKTWRYMFIYEFCPACGHDMKIADGEKPERKSKEKR